MLTPPKTHLIWYLVSLSTWSYTFLYNFTANVFVCHMKMVLFYNVQTTNSTFVGKKINEMYNKQLQHRVIPKNKWY